MFVEALPASIYRLACYSFREQLHLQIHINVCNILLSSLSRESSVTYSMHDNSWLLMVHVLLQTEEKYSRVCFTACCHGS